MIQLGGASQTHSEPMSPLGDPVDLVGLRWSKTLCISPFSSHVDLLTVH